MNINRTMRYRMTILAAAVLAIAIASSRLQADSGNCGAQTTNLPFMDVGSSPFFCQIAEAYFSGLTNGTSGTTYSPHDPVSREQMAAFITRTQDSALRRGSRRAALNQWASPAFSPEAMTTVGFVPQAVQSDGLDLWVANSGDGTVSRVRASDGRLLGTWAGADAAFDVLVARGRIFIAGQTNPGHIYSIDPAQPVGAVSIVATLPAFTHKITTDGSSIWAASLSGSVSKVNISTGGVTTVTGFQTPEGILYDGANIWVTSYFGNSILRLNSNGSIVQSVPVGLSPLFPIFDGTNFWIPNSDSNTVTVVRASTGAVVATLTGNGLNTPISAAFDGQRILVTNFGGYVSLWNAADLTPLGSSSADEGSIPYGACSDGLNFWITLQGTNKLARF